MTTADRLCLALLLYYLIREAAMMEDDPWISGRDPGDETKPRLQRECPKCKLRNQLRTLNGLDPLPGHIRVRARDGAVWCRPCDQAFFPELEAVA